MTENETTLEIAGEQVEAKVEDVPEVQAKAERFQGLLPDLGALLARRLPAHAARP